MSLELLSDLFFDQNIDEFIERVVDVWGFKSIHSKLQMD